MSCCVWILLSFNFGERQKHKVVKQVLCVFSIFFNLREDRKATVILLRCLGVVFSILCSGEG